MFRLSKWYLDCVTETGDASIIYTGKVQWGAIRVHYSSLLQSSGKRVTVTNSLRDHGEPVASGSSISWRMPALNIDGEWRSSLPALQETVFSCDEGAIEWHCLMPNAHVRMSERTGLGYVEKLTMTIAPWKLPIQELRWGRFTAASDSVIWIDWQGEFRRRIAFQNGKPVRPPAIQDDQIQLEDGARLVLDRGLVLREGPLGTTALSGVPGVRDTFPVRILQINECKWRSRARLERPGKPVVESWAIHERVSWPK